MKLVEKKCPGCGAGLKFNENDTSVTCEYCNKTLHIQRDEKKMSTLDEAHIDEAFKFVNEVGIPLFKSVAKINMVVFIVPIIFFVIIAIAIFSTFSSFEKDNSFSGSSSIFEGFDKDEDKDDTKYLSKISEIDGVSMSTFHDNSISVLNRGIEHLKTYEKVTDWESCGVYLLISKEDKSENLLYDIFKKSYKNSKTGETLEMYAAVKYDGLELTEENIIATDYYGVAADPMYYIDKDNNEFVRGYVGNDKIYNQLIRSQSSKYTIEASEGLYVED